MIILAKPETKRPTYAVEIDGKQVGRIEPYEADQWHAVINLRFGVGLDYTLLQGYSTDPIESIDEAVTKGIEHHEAALIAIKEFAAKVAAERKGT